MLEDKHDSDSKKEEQKKSGTSMGHVLRTLKVLRPAFSDDTGSLTKRLFSMEKI